AEIAGGPRAVKYGTTKDYVLGLEFVLPDGSLIATGGKYVKNATGYNLAGIILGSEGTLAVVTKIYLRLITAPPFSIDLLIPCASIEEAAMEVFRILTARVIPAAMEFMERDAIAITAEYLKGEMPFPDAGAHLLIQIDGDTEEAVQRDIERLSGALQDRGERIIIAQSPPQRERLWKARRSIREAIHAQNPVFLAEDCVVPRSRIPEFVREIKRFLSSHGLSSILFGHAGDGNVHIDTLKGEMDYQRWKELVPELKRGIYGIAISLGGTITGEHGIGCIRKDYMGMAMSQEALDLHRRIKKAFDANMILNPGKVC
ncbi:MAG: FAD-binding oxidoreductase, partial [Spirochaetes bacterium]|nr:FAD-binding oxidoreductase [Spirochaetota bacterium]